MLHSPTMPRWRMAWMAMARRRWYSSLVSVCDGAMTMLSPVWMPMGSKFSMLQTVTQLSARSRTTSYSISFQPSRYSSMRICGAAVKARRRASRSSRGRVGDAAALAAEGVGDAGHDRVADRPGRPQAGLDRPDGDAPGRLEPDLGQGPVEELAVLGLLDGLHRRPEDGHARPARRTPLFHRATPQLRAVWPPKESRSACGLSRAMTFSTKSGVTGRK